MRFKFFSLFGFLLALFLVTGSIAGNALAASDSGGASDHDMSTMNQSGQNSGQDMDNMDGMKIDDINSHNVSNNGGGHEATNGSHGSGNGGHGEGSQEATPPNWPLIYGFLGFNALVIIAAALMKNRGVQRNGVN